MMLEVKNPPARAGNFMRQRFSPWVRKIPWKISWQPTPVFFPGPWTEYPDSLQSTGSQSQTQLKRLSMHYRRRHWHPTPVLLPGKSHGWRSLVGCIHGVSKSQTRLSDFTFTFHVLALEKEMATHSSVLAWRILEREEPGGLPSMGSHRVDMTEVT